MRELGDHERNLIEKIDEFGYFKMSVFDPDEDDPNFTYSVGFNKSFGQPECIILGLGVTLMQKMIDVLFDKFEDGLALHTGVVIDDLLGGGFKCIAMPVNRQHITAEYFSSAMWHNRHCGGTNDTFQAYQIIWPGAANGLYPWQDEDVASLQPLLCSPPEMYG